MILRGYKHNPHSCCDGSKKICSKCSIEEEVPDLIFERTPDYKYFSSFTLEEAKWPSFAIFLFREESFVMSSLRGLIVDLT